MKNLLFTPLMLMASLHSAVGAFYPLKLLAAQPNNDKEVRFGAPRVFGPEPC